VSFSEAVSCKSRLEAYMRQPTSSYPLKHPPTSPKGEPCSLFRRDMTNLYLLSLMLTADTSLAESCFVSSLDDCMGMKTSIREWTNDWTRRVVVHNAMRLMRSTAGNCQPVASCKLTLKPVLRAIMRLKSLERFVFVLAILEGYSDRECSLLLGFPVREIAAAKVRALENLAAKVSCSPRAPQALQKTLSVRHEQMSMVG